MYFWAQAGNSLRLLFAKHATCWQEKRLLIMPEAHQIDIHHVAKLARLALTEEEAGRFESQLDGILSYIDTLTRYDLEGVEPTAHAMPVYDVLRTDQPREWFSQDQALGNAPKRLVDQFQIPKVIE